MINKAVLFLNARGKQLRELAGWVGLAIIFLVLSCQLVFLETKPDLVFNDFIAFWSAGRLNATGHNPYAPEKLLPLQKEIGREKSQPERTWNPPWTLLFIMPFGILNYSVAAKFWLLMNLGIVLICTDWIWRYHGGPLPYRGIAWLTGLSFFPTFYVLGMGQISPLVLLGIVGFLYFIEKQKGFLAGLFILLIAIKPNLVYLFWIAVVFWVVERRRWSVLMGFAVAILTATAISLRANPGVINDYLDAVGSAPNFLSQWATPTLGVFLRILLGTDRMWLQFIPTIMGIIWFSVCWIRHHRAWEWRKEMPVLLLVSMVTTIYAWGYDLVVILISVIQAMVWIFRHGRASGTFWAIIGYLGISLLGYIMQFIYGVLNAFWYIWMAPAILFWYWRVREKFIKEPNLTA